MTGNSCAVRRRTAIRAAAAVRVSLCFVIHFCVVWGENGVERWASMPQPRTRSLFAASVARFVFVGVCASLLTILLAVRGAAAKDALQCAHGAEGMQLRREGG